MLHQVFDYSHAEIARMLDISEALSRQSLHRAREHVAANKPRFEVRRENHERLMSAFVAAVSRGDAAAISSIMAEDVALYGDHAEGKRGAILVPIIGPDKVARFFASQVGKLPAEHGLAVEITDVNGLPALVGRRDGIVSFVINIETDGEKIVAIRSMMNPEKLGLRYVC